MAITCILIIKMTIKTTIMVQQYMHQVKRQHFVCLHIKNTKILLVMIKVTGNDLELMSGS